MNEEYVNAQQAFETLHNFLEEDGWYPQQIEDRMIYRVGFEGNNGRMACYAQVRPELEQFLFYVVAPIKVAEEKRPIVAEFITRANYGLRIGNFEMDFSDGEVRYKSSFDFEGVQVPSELFKNTIYPAVQTMDHYLPGLLSTLYSDITAADAIANIESGDDDVAIAA